MNLRNHFGKLWIIGIKYSGFNFLIFLRTESSSSWVNSPSLMSNCLLIILVIFDIVAGVLQGDTLAPYLFIICLDYVLRTLIDKIRENGFKLTKKRSRRYPAKTIANADYADDIAILANTRNQAKTLLHSLEWAAAGIGHHANAHKTENMCYNQTGDFSTLNRTSLKLVDKFTYLRSSLINQKRHWHTANKGIDSYR